MSYNIPSPSAPSTNVFLETPLPAASSLSRFSANFMKHVNIPRVCARTICICVLWIDVVLDCAKRLNPHVAPPLLQYKRQLRRPSERPADFQQGGQAEGGREQQSTTR